MGSFPICFLILSSVEAPSAMAFTVQNSDKNAIVNRTEITRCILVTPSNVGTGLRSAVLIETALSRTYLYQNSGVVNLS